MRNTYLNKVIGSSFCFLFALVLQSNAQRFVNTPVLHYTFDDIVVSDSTATDASASGADGKIHGTVRDTVGYIDGGNGLIFDGTTYIEVPQDALEVYSDLGSVAMWTQAFGGRIRTMWSGGPEIGDGGGFGPTDEMHLHLEGAASNVWAGGEISFVLHSAEMAGKPFFEYSDPEKGNGTQALGAPPVNPITLGDSTWHHVAITWGEDHARMYYDGEIIVDTAYAPTFVPFKLSFMKIGSMLGGGRNFIGVLDDVRVYDGVLAEEDVMDLYNNDIKEVTGFDKTVAGTSVYPNPVSADMNINFVASSKQEVGISLINLNGQKVLSTVKTATQGANKLTLNVANLNRGVYFLNIMVDGNKEVTKVFLK